jgi:hypothetical protein
MVKGEGYYVKGAVYSDSDYREVKEGQEVWNLGPFQKESAASLVWKALMLDWSGEEYAHFYISHSQPESYWVVGGRYKDTAFQEIEGEQEERYGPYTDYDEAHDVWRSKSLTYVDDCMVRYRLDKTK